LNAITASTSQAAFAANAPDGRCANAESFKSALMIACPRWILSMATVSITSGSTVVKKAWNRQTSNKVSRPAALCLSVFLPGPRSEIRRTTSRPGTRSVFLREANAANGISATSAREIQSPVLLRADSAFYGRTGWAGRAQ
jgi:hypothetical protein